MAEEELLDVQKMLSLGQGKSRRSAFGMKELRDRAELRGDCRSLETGGASLGVPQPWELDGSVQGALQPCPGGSGSSSLCHPFPALPSPEDEDNGDNELSLAFSQGREAEPLSRVGTSFSSRALRLGGTTLQHLGQDQSFLLEFQG